MQKKALIMTLLVCFFVCAGLALCKAEAESDIFSASNMDNGVLYISPSHEIYCVVYFHASLLKPQVSSIMYRLEGGNAVEILRFDRQFVNILYIDSEQYIIDIDSFSFPLFDRIPYKSTLAWVDRKSKEIVKAIEFDESANHGNVFFMMQRQLFRLLWVRNSSEYSLAKMSKSGTEELLFDKFDETEQIVFGCPSALFIHNVKSENQSEILWYDAATQTMKTIKNNKLIQLVTQKYLSNYMAYDDKIFCVCGHDLFYTFLTDENEDKYCISPFMNKLDSDFFYRVNERLYVISNRTLYSCSVDDYIWKSIYVLPDEPDISIDCFIAQDDNLYIYGTVLNHSRLDYSLFYCNMSEEGKIRKLMETKY